MKLLTNTTSGIFLSLSLSLCLAPAVASAACTVDSDGRKVISLWSSADQSQKAYGSKTKPEDLNVNMTGCQNEFVQVALGVTIPSAQSYAGLTYFTPDLLHAEKCDINMQGQVINAHQSEIITPMMAKTSSCVGVEIYGTDNQDISIINQKDCRVLSKKDGHVLLQGETCTFKASGGYKIFVKNLKCDIKNDNRILDVDLRMSIQTTDGTAGAGVESIFTKNFRYSISDVDSRDNRTVKEDSPEQFSVFRKPIYQLDFDLYNLRLEGSRETGLMASTRYFIDHQNLNNSNSANNIRVPFVVKNYLYLVKPSSSEPVLLGQWYNASVVSPQWRGLDGNPTFNALAQGPVTGVLGKESKNIERGDLIVLKSKLENPNRGSINYYRYLKAEIARITKNQTKAMALKTKTKFEGFMATLPVLESLPTAGGLVELPMISGDPTSVFGKAKRAVGAWSHRFDQVCNQKGDCLDIGGADDLKTIETVYQVTEDQFAIQLTPVKTLTKWGSTVSPVQNLIKLNTIQCL